MTKPTPPAESYETRATSHRRSKDTLLLVAKVGITVVSFYVISRSVSWGGALRSLVDLRIGWFGAAIFIFWVAQIVSSVRCAYVARGLSGELDLETSVRAHFAGLWFNQVLPTGLGGDMVKIAKLKSRLGLSIATRAAVLDRVSGLMMLLFALTIQLPLYPVYFDNPHWLTSIGLASSAILVSIVAISGVANSVTQQFRLPFGVRHLGNLMADVWTFRKGRLFWQQFWTSLVVHFNGIACFALIAQSMGIHVDLILLVLAVPVVFVAALFPVSFAGWGVREAGAIWIFGTIGIPKESALGMSVGFGILLLIAGLPGLLVWALNK